MRRAFDITGINPATQRVVEVTILAETAGHARVLAAQCGLQQVLVRIASHPQISEPAVSDDHNPSARPG